MNRLDGVKAALLLFVAAILQVSIFSQVHVLGGVPDFLLVTLVAVSLLRGAIVGAVGGFFAGLIVDTATLGTLGLTSLVLTIAGYWIGRYGETTGRDRGHAPFTSVAVITVLYSFGLLHRALRARRAGAGRRDRARPPAGDLHESHPDRAGVRARAHGCSARARTATTRPRCSCLASTTTERAPRRPLPRGKSAVEPYRVTPKLALRVAILGGILLAIFAALFLRLWALQVLAGQKYVAQAQANSFRVFRCPRHAA